MSATSNFMRGAGDVWRGTSLILGRPRLWIWILIPFVLNAALFGLIAWGAWYFAWDRISHMIGSGFWWDMLGWIISVAIWIMLAIFVIFLFVPIGALIALPFNDILSEKVEIILTGSTVDESISIRSLARSIAVGTKTGLRLTLVTLSLLIPVLLLNFIPVIGNALSVGLSAAITIRFLALEFTSYSMDRRYYDYRRREEFMRRNRARAVGLGAMAWVLMLIPVVNALFIPVSAVAGTILFCETELAPGGAKSTSNIRMS
ncbi:EI24 domain-containing protein [bacterium]|nr:EI24 domain-containing protein [bacterium]